MTDQNGWSKAEMFVTSELARLSGEIRDLRDIMLRVHGDLAALKMGDRRHAIIFGLLGGAAITFLINIVAWKALQ